ncbi:MAG TPA: DUF2127 domain-containing protein [Acidobacteriaceae bacterium]|nr:DUF2127 domain-containing protein [Acidobacteriaceae bacterium]
MHPEAVSVSPELKQSRTRSKYDRWIVAIGAFKLLQAMLFVLLGIGALRLLHADLPAMTEHFIVDVMRFNPEGHFVKLVLDRVALIDPHRMRQISAAIFAIAALDSIEGIGLMLEKAWAEFVTLILTASFLPLELFEMMRRMTWIRAGLTAINIAVLLYLVWYVKMRMREREERLGGRL